MPPEVEIKITANGESHYRGANDPDALCLYYTLADRHAQHARRQSRALGDPILVMFWSVMLAAFCFSVVGFWRTAPAPTPHTQGELL